MLKIIKTRFLVIISLIMASILFWEPCGYSASSTESTLKGLSERYQGMVALKAAYQRTTVSPTTDQIFKGQASQTATGTLYWQHPASLKLDQASPLPELLTTDGRTVWWYSPEEKQVHLYPDLDLAGEMAPLLTFLSGIDALRKHFKIKAAPAEESRPKQIGLILESLDSDVATGQITVWCDQKYQLTGFQLSSVTGEKTDFFLTDFDTPVFEEGFFVFIVPKGVVVVEERD